MKKIFTLFFHSILALSLLFICSCGTVESKNNETNAVEKYWASDTYKGMQVDENGVLTLADEPYYGFGINYYSMFAYSYSSLNNEYDLSVSKAGIDQLSGYKIPVARINIGGYGASNSNDSGAYNWVERYLNDTTGWLNSLEELVNYSESKQMGLIFSFIWNLSSVPYHFGESCASFGDPQSKTYDFLRTFTSDIVNRFKESKAVFGWELGNEWNLQADLSLFVPNEKEFADFRNLKAEDYAIAAKLFDETISAADPYHRMISSGNAALRPSQYNQIQGQLKADTPEEHTKALEFYHPGNFNAVSDHVYDFPGMRDYGTTLAQYLNDNIAAAKSMKKSFYLGEWGLNISGTRTIWDPNTKADTAQMMTLEWCMDTMEEACNTIIDCRVQMTLFWNFDPQDMTEASFCLKNVQGTVSGAKNTKYGKFILNLCKKLNKESYPSALQNNSL